MRIILGLAAGMAAMAIASPAAARPGGGFNGPGGGLQTGWSNGGGHQGAKGVRTRFGIGRIEIDPRPGHHHRRHGRSGRHGLDGYGGLGIAGGIGAVDPYGGGFFTGGGGRIRLRGGQPYYDYDRSYPYEGAPAAEARVGPDESKADRFAEPRPRCTMENAVRVCRGW